jgi:hypothetical protein
MAIGTVTATRAGSTFPVAAGGGAGVAHVAWGTYNIAAATADGDIIKLCKLPAGATVIDACIYGEDIDTGTEAWDADLGWAANGDEVADPDGLGNLGVLTGDAFGSSEVGVRAFSGGVLRTAGPKTFNAETTIQLEVNTAANAGGTGRITCWVLYTTK